MARLILTANPSLKRLLTARGPQWLLQALLLAGFVFAIVSGLTGTPVGSRNFSIVFVWIAWWAALILVAVPLLGRGWCSVCPIPLPGEWLQRGSMLDPSAGRKHSGRRWPKALRNIWLQNLSFALVALFSAAILTNPSITSIVLASMLCVAAAISLIFERRAFCRYVCPVGGFIGLYSQAAPLELRVKEREACLGCQSKACYNGSAQGYGCPWDVFPGGLTRNTYCGLCLECMRTCPRENIALSVRSFGADLEQPAAKMDEAFKAFIMLGSAMVYAGVLLGPWGGLKQSAFQVGSAAWLLYAAAFVTILFGILPGLFLLAVRISSGKRSGAELKKHFSELASSLIPLGLMGWIAFSLSFVLTNASYIASSLSDPLGRGWDLFGTASLVWQPILTWLVGPLQTGALVLGLLWSANNAWKICARRKLAPAAIIMLILILSLMMTWLLL